MSSKSSSTKKYKLTNTNTIVIVESPAKCKKIEQYLGPGYKVIASFGHLRELGSLKNIDIENDFSPNYQIINDDKKKKHIEFMRKDIASADEVILATDDDREGEAIAWHICMLFELPINKTKRIVFHEITEQAIQHAISCPRFIQMNTVYSQQARQILDLLVGFTVSPMLWKYIAKNMENSLSAGRCQTPALKLIYDNHVDIQNSPGKNIYTTIGYFTNQNLPFELNKQYENEDSILNFLEESVNFDHMYSCSSPKKIMKPPPEPLTTSRIQQLASNEMHISPKETMRLCQILYEEGYITYMRTDSKKYSRDFIESSKNFILKEYNDAKYIHPQIDRLVNNSADEIDDVAVNDETKKPKKGTKKSAQSKKATSDANPDITQQAHEAIRPTNISLKTIDDKMQPREKKLYKLIWETSLESCMSDAEYLSVKATITAPYNNNYNYTSEMNEFPGWKIVKNKLYDAESTTNKAYTYLQTIKKDSIYDYKKITCSMTLKDMKHHYTEAKLVQLLEENGIGRPSTFSMLVDKIQERGYVKKDSIEGKKIVCTDFELDNDTIIEKKVQKEFGNEKNKLVIQPLGLIVIDFLYKHFNQLFNYDYTRNMEEDLDRVSKGELLWANVCRSCLDTVDASAKELKNEKKHEIKIDDTHSYIIGKYGPVIRCVDGFDENGKEKIIFKTIKPGIDITKLENGEYALSDLIATDTKKEDHVLGKYQGHDLVIKKGKYGLYLTWGECTKSLSSFGNRPLENVTYDEVLKLLMKDEEDGKINKKGSSIVREITSNISIRNGSYGDYIFFKTPKMKKPVFYKLHGFKGDYKNCNIDILKNWIIDEYKIRI